MKKYIVIEDAPFFIGAQVSPSNPLGLPNRHPLKLCFDEEFDRIFLESTPVLERLLSRSYDLGCSLGTPSDDTELGKPYVEDFFEFVNRHSPNPGSMLEIGAGTGYVSRRFIDIGWKVDALEPGIGYAEKWSEYNVDVINSFYPCEDISDKKYDAIIAYTVLEHISNTEMFLKEISKQLAPNGKVFIAVPNCSDEIALADPSMLLHEHFQYFTRKSLEAAMKEVNLTASVSCSKFGRLLYAVAEKSSSEKQTKKLSEQFSDNESYFLRVSKTRDVVAKKLAQLSTNGPVGIYCPSRALYFLSDKSNYRFFDDAAYLHDKFLPPFYSKIESREAFLADPPAYCVIFSRTFGSVLKTELSIALKSGGKTSTILTIDEIISNGLGVETSA